MQQQTKMFETKMKALEQLLWEELRADTEKQVQERMMVDVKEEVMAGIKEIKEELKVKMEKVKEEVKKEVEELIPQCAVVKEMRGESIFTTSS